MFKQVEYCKGKPDPKKFGETFVFDIKSKELYFNSAYGLVSLGKLTKTDPREHIGHIEVKIPKDRVHYLGTKPFQVIEPQGKNIYIQVIACAIKKKLSKDFDIQGQSFILKYPDVIGVIGHSSLIEDSVSAMTITGCAMADNVPVILTTEDYKDPTKGSGEIILEITYKTIVFNG